MAATHFVVSNTSSGLSLGLFAATSADEAISAMMADAGCDDEPSPELVAHPLEAVVTARGADSSVPDNNGAVDFRLTAGGATFDVTLLPDGFTGKLDIWGQPDHWCSDYKGADTLLKQLDWPAIVVATCRRAA